MCLTGLIFCPVVHISPFLPCRSHIHSVNEGKSAPIPYVYVNSSGSVKNYRPMQVVVACSLEMYAFPFDKQNCSLTFRSWLHSGVFKACDVLVCWLIEFRLNTFIFTGQEFLHLQYQTLTLLVQGHLNSLHISPSANLLVCSVLQSTGTTRGIAVRLQSCLQFCPVLVNFCNLSCKCEQSP